MDVPFDPPVWARSPHLQTIFGSLKLRALGGNEMSEAAQEMIIDAGSGVRLLGYYSRQSIKQSKGLVILIHGWEGSADSTYILSSGLFLYRKGYHIFRLNLRDHGDSHHLNRGLFHGALIEETAKAVEVISRLFHEGPSYLVGFSLGGNFALRIALRQSHSPISNLKDIFCISPALDPYKSTLAIDASSPVYRLYFLRKWKKSLRKKERCYPDLYHFDTLMYQDTCMGLTKAIMPYYTEWGNYMEYFRRYTLTGDFLTQLRMPVTIFISQDDPFIAIDDFYRLPLNPCIHLSIQKYGGHCGFLDPFPFGCWYERRIVDIMESRE